MFQINISNLLALIICFVLAIASQESRLEDPIAVDTLILEL